MTDQALADGKGQGGVPIGFGAGGAMQAWMHVRRSDDNGGGGFALLDVDRSGH